MVKSAWWKSHTPTHAVFETPAKRDFVDHHNDGSIPSFSSCFVFAMTNAVNECITTNAFLYMVIATLKVLQG